MEKTVEILCYRRFDKKDSDFFVVVVVDVFLCFIRKLFQSIILYIKGIFRWPANVLGN